MEELTCTDFNSYLRTRSLGPLAFMICKVHCLSSQTDISVALNLYPVYDVRLIVSYRSYNLNVILVRILDETYISPFLDPQSRISQDFIFWIEIFHA